MHNSIYVDHDCSLSDCSKKEIIQFIYKISELHKTSKADLKFIPFLLDLLKFEFLKESSEIVDNIYEIYKLLYMNSLSKSKLISICTDKNKILTPSIIECTPEIVHRTMSYRYVFIKSIYIPSYRLSDITYLNSLFKNKFKIFLDEYFLNKPIAISNNTINDYGIW